MLHELVAQDRHRQRSGELVRDSSAGALVARGGAGPAGCALISHRHRCLYVKVPKCASNSLRDWFFDHARGRPTHHHARYRGTLPERIPGVARALELWPGYRSFTFMRNPYRRFVSGYLHAARAAEGTVRGNRLRRAAEQPPVIGTMSEYAELCAELIGDTRGLWGREALAFRRAHAERRYGPLGIRLRHLDFVSGHARPQVDFLPDCNPERLFGVPRRRPAGLSFIGDVEDLDAHFDRLRALLDLPPDPLPRSNASSRPAGALESLRGDAATRRAVERLYAEDFAFAGYPVGDMDGRAARLPLTARDAVDGSAAPGHLVLRASFRMMSAGIALEARLRPAGIACRAFVRLLRRT